MAVVNSDILRIIAFNDYKHDSKPKHGVRGASPEDVKLFVTPTLPIGISSAGIFISIRDHYVSCSCQITI